MECIICNNNKISLSTQNIKQSNYHSVFPFSHLTLLFTSSPSTNSATLNNLLDSSLIELPFKIDGNNDGNWVELSSKSPFV